MATKIIGGEQLARAGFECVNYPHKSKAEPSTCREDCSTCKSHFRSTTFQRCIPYLGKLPDDAAADMITGELGSSRACIAFLKEVIEKNGNAIRKRWLKRTAKQRAALLAAHAPTMYRSRWTEADGFKDSKRSPNGQESKGVHTPFLSHELLSHDPTKFLCLLHARTTYSPEEWIVHDMMAQKHDWDNAVMQSLYNPHCVVVAPGEDFGKLVPWDADKAHRWDVVGFPRAHGAFSGQGDINRMLMEVTTALLEDQQSLLSGRDGWDAAAAVGFRDASSKSPIAYWDAPFIAPPQFNTEHIRDLVRAACDATRQEFHILQTDWRQLHRFLANLDAFTRSQSPDMRYHYLAKALRRTPYLLDKLRTCFDQIMILTNIIDASKHLISADDPLPDEYGIALRTLDKIIRTHRPNLELHDSMLKSAAFQQYFFLSPNGAYHCELSIQEAYPRDRLLWNLMRLTKSEANVPYHLAYINDIRTKSSHDDARLDESMVGLLRIMASVDEARSTVNYHRPFPGGELTTEEFMAEAELFGLSRMDKVAEINTPLFELQQKKLPAFIKKFMELPLPRRRRTRETVERTKALQEASDDLWREMRRMRISVVAQLDLTDEETEKYVTDYDACISEEHKKEYHKELESLEAALNVKQHVPGAQNDKPVFPSESPVFMQTEWGHPVDSKTITPRTPRDKVKRRARAHDDQDHPNAAQRAQNQPEPEPESETGPVRIAVSAASLALLTRMFTPRLTVKGSADTKWELFMSAMSDAGCAARKTGGVAVTFLWEGRRFTVHRPHPNPTINPIMLGDFGRKARDAFGWEVDTFVERAKADK